MSDSFLPIEMLNSLFFTDGIRSIDFVCVWSPSNNEESEVLRSLHRKYFEKRLEDEGLQLERESVVGDLHFVMIHAPLEVLRRYAEILKLRMPMKKYSSSGEAFKIRSKASQTVCSKVKEVWNQISKHFIVNEKLFPRNSKYFTAIYSRDNEYLFDLSHPTFFDAACRRRVVKFILDRTRCSIGKLDAFGIDRLISLGVYRAAYALHDGENRVEGSVRNLLFREWASISKWYRYQPLDCIKSYFGSKIGLYFAWLGFYTYMLIFPSLFGVCCLLFSLTQMMKDKPSEDTCSGRLSDKMCPLCDECDYWDLKEACIYYRINYLFNNWSTIAFAIFMSFWAKLFLVLWKRYSNQITHQWDLTGFDLSEEQPRTQFLVRLANVQNTRSHYLTNSMEPHPPFWRMKVPAMLFSFATVVLLLALSLVVIFAVIFYKMSMGPVLLVYRDEITTSRVMLIVHSSASFINLCFIMVFNKLNKHLATYLTELELHRTQSEFDDAWTLKLYLLRFVNEYGSLFYLAFLKGRLTGYPGNYNRIFGFRREECGIGGCIMELCIQLVVISVGKQIINGMIEMIFPNFLKWLNIRKIMKKNKLLSIKNETQQWLRDLRLSEWKQENLFSEYLEMVLQYGIVTIFVAAFPLAPLFALLNNIFEMRFDARKLLTFYRRPVLQRANNMGIWFSILDGISKISVLTNGFIIAFTSDVVPRMVYRIIVSTDGSLEGYLNHSLSYFNASDFQNGSAPNNSIYNIEVCRYIDYREPSNSSRPYERTIFFWTVLTARVCFVVVFENIVALVVILVRWFIPDVPTSLKMKMKREAHVINEFILKQELITKCPRL